jgi:hypothetical protein
VQIEHKKNTAYYLAFPMVDSATPANFKSGVSPVDTAYYKDGAGAWTSLSITDTASEIGSTGVYEIDLTAAELNHDQVIVKFAVAGAADTAFLFDMRTKLVSDLNDVALTDILSDSTAFAGANIDAAISSRLAPTTASRTLDVTDGGCAGVDWANVEAPTSTVGLSNTTVGTVTTNTDMRGTDSAALASVVGALADAAAAGDPTEADTLMQYAKQLVNVLVGTAGVTTFPAGAAPANGVSLAEALRATYDFSVSSAAWGSINSGIVFRGTVTAADPGVSFTIGGLAGQGVGAFIDANTPWYAYVFRDAGGAGAAPQGEQRQVTGYTSATGLFTTEAFTQAVAVGDDVIVMSGRIAAVPDILADTVDIQAQIGTAGAGLTDLGGMSTGMKAEIEAECTDALNAYDPPTNAEMEARTLVAANYFTPSTDTVDGITWDSAVTAILATLLGVVTVPQADQRAFKQRNGTTTKVTITYGSTDGERTVSVIA